MFEVLANEKGAVKTRSVSNIIGSLRVWFINHGFMNWRSRYIVMHCSADIQTVLVVEPIFMCTIILLHASDIKVVE